MRPALALRMGQSLAMTPALQQAIRMLQLSTLDLQQEIQQALDSNMMLERTDELDSAADDTPEPAADDTKANDDAIPDDLPVDADWNDIYDGGSHRSREADEAWYEYRQANLHKKTSLREHLAWQADLAGFSESEADIAAHLIDAVDDRGYLADWPTVEARLQELDHDGDAITSVLGTVQRFDPAGVCARSLSECLHIQLDGLNAGPVVDLAKLIADEHLDALARNDMRALSRALRQPVDVITESADLIRSLQPHPGADFTDHEAEYVAPEVFVTKKNGRWSVSLNPDITPKLRINTEYLGLVKRADQSEDQQCMKQHLQEARYFLNSLKSRNETLLRVAQCIIEQQRAFLEYGEEAMKPLVLRDVAEQLGVHESTVSRETSSKYMHTPRGLFELKYFFSSHVSTVEGGQCSATAIQAMIRRMIKEEPPEKPLSDSRIAKLLLEDGIQVARRTVAKYREAMDLPPSHERRRMV